MSENDPTTQIASASLLTPNFPYTAGDKHYAPVVTSEGDPDFRSGSPTARRVEVSNSTQTSARLPIAIRCARGLPARTPPVFVPRKRLGAHPILLIVQHRMFATAQAGAPCAATPCGGCLPTVARGFRRRAPGRRPTGPSSRTSSYGWAVSPRRPQPTPPVRSKPWRSEIWSAVDTPIGKYSQCVGGLVRFGGSEI